MSAQPPPSKPQHRHPPGSPWQHGRKPNRHGKGHRRGRPRALFLRFFTLFGLMSLLIAGSMAALAFVVTRLFEGDGRTAVLVWVGGCSLALSLPLLAGWLAVNAFQRIARPLSAVMSAADAVADGDLSARVPEQRRGDFQQLARSFNRMATELERADEQRRNLTADVAHELRTPLHIIQGNLEGVLDGVYEPTAAHIGDTLEETQLLARLVEDLRILSLAEAGQLPLQQAFVSVAELLRDAQTSFSGQAAAAQSALAVALPQADLQVWGDADRLNQVLSNLLANALRHTVVNGRIEVQARAAGDGVQITVTDDGEGIAAEALPFVFDRFWKGEKSRTHGAGSGLGLAITKQLVLAHNGRIEVESAPDAGTTFSLWLPSAPDSQDD